MERREAIKQNLTHYNTGRPCKHGHISSRRVNDRVCMACDISNKNKRPYDKAYKHAQYEKHKSHILEYKRVYRQINSGKINALVAARKQYIKQRTPSWDTSEERWLVKEVYELATKRSQMTGFKWHVDHIIPLQGKTVSGLHTITNLQVIPGIENIRKKNSYAE